LKSVEYRINDPIAIKSDVTYLAPLLVQNSSDNDVLLVPVLTERLPDDIVFLAECQFLPAHSSVEYSPKLFKIVGADRFYNIGKLPNGIAIKLLMPEFGTQTTASRTVSDASIQDGLPKRKPGRPKTKHNLPPELPTVQDASLSSATMIGSDAVVADPINSSIKAAMTTPSGPGPMGQASEYNEVARQLQTPIPSQLPMDQSKLQERNELLESLSQAYSTK
jgi:hypothetical protein